VITNLFGVTKKYGTSKYVTTVDDLRIGHSKFITQSPYALRARKLYLYMPWGRRGKLTETD